jgi:cytochrome c oxidase subunit 3
MVHLAKEPISPPILEQFANEAQRRETVQQGMWLFLATEVMMFGTLIFISWYFRLSHPREVAEAIGHMHFGLGASNSVLLLTSSLTMSFALRFARAGTTRPLQFMLLVSAALALLFLGLKGYEYHAEFDEGLLPGFGPADGLQERPARLYMGLYLVATALHAVHMIAAITLVLALCLRLQVGRLQVPERVLVIETAALYWHVVDVIWIVLYPSLYLAGRPA